MAKAWIEGNNIFITMDETIAPKDAINVPDNTTPQDLVIDNGQLRLKTEEEKLQDKKQELLQQLPDKTKAYIEKYYPEVKQRSDINDKENGESYLVLQGFDTATIRKDITAITLQNYPDFANALQSLTSKYNTTNQLVSYWLTQLLKVAFRNYFVFLVKQEFSTIKQTIENATTIEELPQKIDFTTQFPAGL